MKSLSRRSLLRGAGGIAVGLPWLEATARGADIGPPKRVLFIHTPNGSYEPNHWGTVNAETDFTLGSIMSPYDAWKGKAVFLRGVNNTAAMATTMRPNGHHDAMYCALTGRPGITSGAGISADQYIANEIGKTTKYKSLEWAFGVGSTYRTVNLSFYGAKQPLPFALGSELYDRLFSGVTGQSTLPSAELAKVKAQRQSVLDSIKENYAVASKGLGKADQQRLSGHLQMVRELEQRMQAGGGTTTCSAPATKGGEDMIAYALACDLTRVATIAYRDGHDRAPLASGEVIQGSYHDDYVHKIKEPHPAAVVTELKRSEIARVTRVLQKLASIPEGNGTLLDNTLVYHFDEFMYGYQHSHKNHPMTFTSGSSRFFKGGRFLDLTGKGVTTNQVVSSVIAMMGVDPVGWGDPQYGAGTVPGLL